MNTEERIKQLESDIERASERIAFLTESVANQQESISKILDHINSLYNSNLSIENRIGESYQTEPTINEKINNQLKITTETFNFQQKAINDIIERQVSYEKGYVTLVTNGFKKLGLIS